MPDAPDAMRRNNLGHATTWGPRAQEGEGGLGPGSLVRPHFPIHSSGTIALTVSVTKAKKVFESN